MTACDPKATSRQVAMLRLSFLTACTIAVGGCVSSDAMQFTAVSVSDLTSNADIVQEGVAGEDCPKGAGSYGSYAEATRIAILSGPPANALINAQFSRVERPFAKICVKVIGDAVKL